MITNIFRALTLLSTIATMAWTQEIPCVYPLRDQVKAHARVKVARVPEGFNYDYLLENRQPAMQPLVKFAVQALRSGGSNVLQKSPSGWEAGSRIRNSTFYVWNTFEDTSMLYAGRSTTGFGFAHDDVPAIVTFLAWGDVEPPSFPEGEAPESCENTDIIENSFKGQTVGPKSPPADFVPIEFLNYLITLLHDSRQLGWIEVDGVHQSLLAKLINAKRKLEEEQSAVAKNMLNAFLNEVQATSCQEFTCPGNKPLTSEAYALLFFNGQFLWERL